MTARILSLPLYPELSAAQQQAVIEGVLVSVRRAPAAAGSN